MFGFLKNTFRKNEDRSQEIKCLTTETCFPTENSLTTETCLTTQESSSSETAVSTPSSEYFDVNCGPSLHSEIHSVSLTNNQRPPQPMNNEPKTLQVVVSNTSTVFHNTASYTLVRSDSLQKTSSSSQKVSNTSQKVSNTSQKVSNTSQKVSNTSQKVSNTTQKVSKTSQNFSVATEKSKTSQKLSNTSQKVFNTSEKSTNTSKKVSNTSQKVSNTSQKVSNTSQKISNTSQKVSNTLQKVSNTSQKVSNSSQKVSVATEISKTSQKLSNTSQKVSNTSQNVSNTSQKVSNSSQKVSNTSQVSNETQTISNTSKMLPEATLTSSPQEVDVIYKMVSDHEHVSTESIELSSNSTTNQKAAQHSPKFMRHLKLPFLNILKTFRRNKPHENQENHSHQNKLSSKTISSEPTINRKQSENNISIDSTFLSVPTFPPNTTELSASIATVSGLPPYQHSPRHYVYQDGDPTLYFPGDPFSSSSDNITSESLTETEVLSYASIIRSKHSALSSLNGSKHSQEIFESLPTTDETISQEIFESLSTTDDTYYDNMCEEGYATSVPISKDATEKYSSMDKLSLEERNSKRFNLVYKPLLGDSGVNEIKKNVHRKTKKQNLAIEYNDGGEVINGRVNRKSESKMLMSCQRNYKCASKRKDSTNRKSRSHKDVTSTSEVKLLDSANSSPNNYFQTKDVEEKVSQKTHAYMYPRDFFNIAVENPFDHMVSASSCSEREDMSHQRSSHSNKITDPEAATHLSYAPDKHLSRNFDLKASSTDSSVGSSTPTLISNKSQILSFKSNNLGGNQRLEDTRNSIMKDVSNHSISRKRNSYLQIKNSKKSVHKIPNITRYSSDVLKEVLNKSKENMSRYTSRVLQISAGKVSALNSRKPDQEILNRSRDSQSSGSSEVHFECTKSSPKVLHNSSVNVSNANTPYPRYFRKSNPEVLSKSKEDMSEAIPEHLPNHRSHVPFREGSLKLNSSPEISKLDQLLDDLEQTSLSENNVLFNYSEYRPIDFTVDEGSYGDEAILRREDDEGEEISNAQWLDGLHDYYSNLAVINEGNGSHKIMYSGSLNPVQNIDDGIPILRSKTYTVLDRRYPLLKNQSVDEFGNLCDTFCLPDREESSDTEEPVKDESTTEEEDDESSEGEIAMKRSSKKREKIKTSISSDSIISTRTYSLGLNLEYLSNREDYSNDDSDDSINVNENAEWNSDESEKTIKFKNRRRVVFDDVEDINNFTKKIPLGQVSRNNMGYLKNSRTNIRELSQQFLNSQGDKNCTNVSDSDEFVDNPEIENWGLEWSKWDAAKKKRYIRYKAMKGCILDYDADTESVVTSSGESGSHGVVDGDPEDDDCVNLTRKGTYTLLQGSDGL